MILVSLGKGGFLSEYKIRNLKGESRWFEGLGQKISFEGKPADIVVLRDITERQKSKEALKARARELEVLNSIITEGNKAKDLNSLLKKVLDLVLKLLNFDGGGIYLVNKDSRKAELKINKGLPKSFIREVKRVDINKNPYNRLFKDKKSIITEDYNKIAPKKFKYKLKSLASIPIIFRKEAIGALNIASKERHSFSTSEKNILESIGRQLGIIIEKRKIDQELQESEEKFRNIFESANDMIIYLSNKGKIIDINSKVKDITGFKSDEVVGHNFLKLGLIKPSDLSKITKAFFRAVRGKPVGIFDLRINDKKGRQIMIEASTRVLKNKTMIIIARDVTERNKLVSKLERSEERYRLISEKTGQLVYEHNLDNNDIKWFGAITDVTGYSAEYFQKINYNQWKNRIHPVDRKEVISELKKAIKNKEEFYLVYRFNCKEGYKYIEDRGVVLDNSIILGVMEDVDERKIREEKIKSLKESYERVFHSTNDVIIVLNLKGEIVALNNAAKRVTGYEPELFINKHFKDLKMLPPKSKMRILKEFTKTILTGRVDKYDIKVITKNGKEKIGEISPSKIYRDGKLINIQAVIRDVTDQRKAENELNEAKKRFEDIALNTADWIWEVDKEGVYTFASGNVEQLLGYKPEEIIGKTPFDLMPEQEAVRVKGAFDKLKIGMKPIVDLENTNLTKNGKKVNLLTNGVPIINDDGSLVGYRGVDRDITKRKE
jgi:PAS domain S-box-containing protein